VLFGGIHALETWAVEHDAQLVSNHIMPDPIDANMPVDTSATCMGEQWFVYKNKEV